MVFLQPVLKPNSKLVRCWRADESPEDWRVKTFHEGCDGKGPTVTIVKVGDNIFGGFTDVPWESKFLRGQSHEDCLSKYNLVPEVLRLVGQRDIKDPCLNNPMSINFNFFWPLTKQNGVHEI